VTEPSWGWGEGVQQVGQEEEKRVERRKSSRHDLHT